MSQCCGRPKVSCCGLAPSTGVLVGARVVQGVGAVLLLPGTLAIMSEAYPGRARVSTTPPVRPVAPSVSRPSVHSRALRRIDSDSFISGLHTAGLVTAALFLAATLATLALIGPGRDNYP